MLVYREWKISIHELNYLTNNQTIRYGTLELIGRGKKKSFLYGIFINVEKKYGK